MEVINKISNNIKERLAIYESLIEDNNKKIRAVGEAVALATSVNVFYLMYR